MRLMHWLLRLLTRKRFCEDCHYYRASGDGISPALCWHELSGEDNAEHLVHRGRGREVKVYTCALMRRTTCGRKGKLWRPK